MPNLTSNFGLKKPLPEEFYDVQVQNDNMDIIDRELKNAKESGGLPLDGSKPMTGNLTIAKQSSPSVILEDGDDGTGSVQYDIDKLVLRNITDEGTVELEIHPSGTDLANLVQLVVNNEYWYNLYGEHNKPTMSDISGTLPISKGGTGSTSATAALTNLGAAKKTHNHTATDINSGTLSSDRLPVIPITKGGTGASNSSQARSNLGISEEYWTFTLEDGTTVTKLVCAT